VAISTPWGYHDHVATTVTSSHRHWLDFGVSGTSRYHPYRLGAPAIALNLVPYSSEEKFEIRASAVFA